MRECQLCGCKSWSPLESSGRALLLMMVRPEEKEVDFAAYRQCDNCNMPALTEIIEIPVSDAQFPEIELQKLPHIADAIFGNPSLSRGPDQMTIAKEALESMASRMPEPQTRLERIVRTVLEAKPACINGQTKEYVALEVVDFARAIEREIDNALEPSVTGEPRPARAP